MMDKRIEEAGQWMPPEQRALFVGWAVEVEARLERLEAAGSSGFVQDLPQAAGDFGAAVIVHPNGDRTQLTVDGIPKPPIVPLKPLGALAGSSNAS